MKAKNKIITIILLSAGALTGTALINKYIKFAATSKNLLQQPEPRCFKWRLGDVYYTKCGSGKPLLLIHDLNHASSGYEWSTLTDILKESYTVYTLDLLGCGRSEKPNLTYTNFLYVQLLNDFIKSEIGHRTNVIATGSSAPLAVMACSYNTDLFDQLMFINPDSISSGYQMPGKSAKLYKLILDLPVIGTLLYHIASGKKVISETFTRQYFYNPYGVKPGNVEKYYESAHLGESPKAVYSSVLCNYTRCNITRALEKIDNSIYVLGGAEEENIDAVIQDFTRCNPAIESSVIPDTKHLPQMENPKKVYETIKMFFN